MRIGHGYDVHRLTEGRRLILGGVEIFWEKGLLGHSDADVLTHAVMDALLGAAGLGDIGRHFPDTDPAYAGADSLKLLAHVMELLGERGFSVGNVDAAILAHEMSMDGNTFGAGEGLVKESVEQTIASIGLMASQGMKETDAEILRIMIGSGSGCF